MKIMDEISTKLKQAMLARDQFLTGVLRDLKSAILYEEVAKKKRDTGLGEEEIQAVIAREVKKRDDAIEIYNSAGDTPRADKETAERQILQSFLPEPLTDDELQEIVQRVIADGDFTPRDMGKVIGAVKTEVGTRADGAKIAALVKNLL
ncbi:MAG: GatB/YqeY domain-containing protein [Candidatus Nomurabacteria bacterium]|nr:GatB/YqeY domain-containing protein [Candidatus Nomurabacteria bacterium]